MGVNRVYAGKRPVDEDGLAYDELFGDEPDVAGVLAEWSVVTKNEVLVWRNTPSVGDRVEWSVGWCINIRFTQQHVIDPDVGAVCLDGVAW